MYKLINLIKEWLDGINLNFSEESKNERFVFILNAALTEEAEYKANIRISIEEDGSYLQFSARCIAENNEFINFNSLNEEQKNDIYKFLLSENYNRKLIKWSIDPEDGDLTATIECNLENSILSKEQFQRNLYSLIYSIDKGFPHIWKIIKNI